MVLEESIKVETPWKSIEAEIWNIDCTIMKKYRLHKNEQ